MSKTTMGVKLDDETRTRLSELGKIRQRSTHWLMLDAIHRYLDGEEQYELEKAEDQRRWENYLDTGRAIPHEGVAARMDEMKRQAEAKASDR